MPYKNKELKAANNKLYKKNNKWLLYALRMMKNGQKSVTQATYDNVKEHLSDTYVSSLRIIGSLKDNVMNMSKQIKIEPVAEKPVVHITPVEPPKTQRQTRQTRQTKQSVEIVRTPSVEPIQKEISPEIYTITEARNDIDKYPAWASSTRKIYKDRILTIMKLLGCDENEDIAKCFRNDYNNIEEIIIEKYPKSSKEYFNTVASLGKASPKFKRLVGEDIINKYDQTRKAKQKEVVSKNLDQVNFSAAEPWNNFIEAGNTLKQPYDQNALIVSLYVHNPVARDAFGSVHMMYDGVIPDNPEANYYMVNTGELVLNEFKTSKRGPHSFIVSTNTKTVIDYITKSNTEQGKPQKKWLLPLKNGKDIGKLAPNYHIHKAFKTTGVKFESQSITVNTLRHSVVTNKLSDKNMTAKKKQVLANNMMSNIIVQALVYDRKRTKQMPPIKVKQLK